MPIQIAAPVTNPLPNQLNRIRLARQPIDHGAAFSIPLFVFHGASGRGVDVSVVVQNSEKGGCSVLRKNATPVSFEDLVIVSGSVDVEDGYDQIDTIMSGAGSKAAKADAILTALLAMGVIDAGLTGPVS